MPLYKIRLESLQLFSPRSKSPYWDQLTTSFIVLVGGEPLKKATQPGGQDGLHGVNGYYGPGMVVDYLAGQTHDGEKWDYEFDLDYNKNTIIQIIVLVQNMRGLPDPKLARLMVELGIAVASAVGGTLIGKAIEAAPTIAKAILSALGAAGGTALKKLLDSILFPEPPDCIGPVYVKSIALTTDDLNAKPFQVIESVNGSQRAIFRDGWSSDPLQHLPEEECGSPSAAVTVAFERSEQWFLVPPGWKPPERLYRPVLRASRKAWLDTWSDSISNLGRVQVGIEPTGSAGVDLVKVTFREALGHWGGEVVASGVVDNLPITLNTHARYLIDIFGNKHWLSGAFRTAADANKVLAAQAAEVNASEPAKDVAAHESSEHLRGPVGEMMGVAVGTRKDEQNTPDTPMINRNPNVPSREHAMGMAMDTIYSSPSIQPWLMGSQNIGQLVPTISGFFEQALTIVLPNHGITLALYIMTIQDSMGKELATTYAVRYMRAGTLLATLTDAMLSPFRPLR